jgi:hypothetical protein
MRERKVVHFIVVYSSAKPDPLKKIYFLQSQALKSPTSITIVFSAEGFHTAVQTLGALIEKHLTRLQIHLLIYKNSHTQVKIYVCKLIK